MWIELSFSQVMNLNIKVKYKNAFQLCTSCPIFPYIKNDKGNMTQKKKG